MGMAGDMFSAALIGLGAPADEPITAMQTAGEALGGVGVEARSVVLPDGRTARRIHVDVDTRPPLPIADAPRHLTEALEATGVRGVYADFAQRALAILSQAERVAHGIEPESTPSISQVSLSIIGHAHTPYHDQAPYQPVQGQDTVASDAFYIELAPAYATGLTQLDTFTHIFVVSYLDRVPGYGMLVRPPWREGDEQYGLFATRSPNRPSPIGLTRTQMRRVKGNRVYTGTLDLYDGTPILDIKPFIRSIDGIESSRRDALDSGNDGWLEGSDHLEIHRRGIPHDHPGGGQLHEAQDILLDLTGAAWGLQALKVDPGSVMCLSPVRVGGGTTGDTSHGRLPVPAPATRAILDEYHIPYQSGPVEAELLTPTGAAILAALSPAFVDRQRTDMSHTRAGVGLGHRVFDNYANVLQLALHH
jgi:tRNA (adenine37-N6)-methyltransferase